MNQDKWDIIKKDKEAAEKRRAEDNKPDVKYIEEYYLLSKLLNERGWREVIDPLIERMKKTYLLGILSKKGEERSEYAGMYLAIESLERNIKNIIRIGAEKESRNARRDSSTDQHAD